jgi:hypothetical protein
MTMVLVLTFLLKMNGEFPVSAVMYDGSIYNLLDYKLVDSGLEKKREYGRRDPSR